METLDTTTVPCTPGSLIQKQGIADTNNYYHRQCNMNTIATAALSSTVAVPTMDQMYSSNYSDSTGTQLGQVPPPNNHHNSTRIDSTKTATKSNSLHDTNYSTPAIDIRSNFQRSHTCGSLFAKCGCSTPSPFDTLIPIDASACNTSTTLTNNDQAAYVNSNSQYHSTQGVKLDNNAFKAVTSADPNCYKKNSVGSSNQEKQRQLSKSVYAHPDIAFIFTDENRNLPSDPSNGKHDRATTITTKNGGQLQLGGHQRLSSPNIGNYAIVDVAVHPEVVLKLSATAERHRQRPLKSSFSEDSSYSYSTTRRPPLQHSHREYYHTFDLGNTSNETLNDTPHSQSTSPVPSQRNRSHSKPQIRKNSDSFARTEISQSASSSFDDLHETDSIDATSVPNTDVHPYDQDLVEPDQDHSTSNHTEYSKTFANQNTGVVTTSSSVVSGTITPTTATAAATVAAITITTSPITSTPAVDPAQKFFQESGILGPLANTSVSLIRKTSKIMQDTNVIEHIRKNSKLLRQGGIYKDELEYTRSMIPNIKIETDKKDQQDKLKHFEEEISHLRDIIKARDNEIYKLKREIHKLKSVLQQTTNHMTIGTDDLLSCNVQSRNQYDGNIIPTIVHPTGSSGSTNCSQLANANTECLDELHHPHHHYHRLSPATSACTITSSDIEPSKNAGGSHNCKQYRLECLQDNNSLDGAPCNAGGVPGGSGGSVAAKANHLMPPQYAAVKKQGVSGESSDPTNQQSNSVPIPKYKKDFRSKQLIKDAIMDNDFLKNIDSTQVRELVESMYSLDVAKGEYVIREGEVGAHLYVSAEGEFEVMKSGKVLGIMGPRKAFGELAILYNCTRTASIRCMTDACVWVLDRRVFQQIMMRTGMQRIEDNVNFLKSVPLLKNLSNEVLAKIADVLEVEFYPAGAYIIRQGASGDTFFLISQGTVKVTQRLSPNGEEKEIRTLSRGDYFGEQALINEDKRTANIIALPPGVECLTLDRESFTHLIGDLCELKEKNYGDENRVLAMKFAETTKEVFGANLKQELQDVELNDFEVVATLGIGGFGRVELVKCYRENRVETYALKCLKKKHILDTRQEEHVFSERTIMLSCKTPFICRLYRTFKDSKYVYMLLEACMGGEVWTILRDRGCFDENTTQFIIGCVLQAFEYLHSRGIIYRDLKPENLMLDERGYVKLVDFGFAKYIGQSSKTWTFCGTPEYVAPEIILNKGHDRAVDYWALGILIHELLNGTPPFTANDPMKTYNIILKGIDMVDFPKHMSRSAVMLIKRLCRDVPAERLGYQKGGIQDIKKHKWFQGFDWDGLADLTLIPPFLRPVSHQLDTSYFDKFAPDMEIPPDEETGWDEDF